MGEALATACDYNDTFIMVKAAKILRKQMLEHEREFDGTLINSRHWKRICTTKFVGICKCAAKRW